MAGYYNVTCGRYIVAHLFSWSVIILQHNPQAHWCISPILALV